MIAAAELSQDRAAVAARCLDLIGQYSADRAALEILSGCAQHIEVETETSLTAASSHATADHAPARGL